MYWQTSSRCSAQTLLALTLLIPVLAFAPVAPAAESAGDAKEAAAAPAGSDEAILRKRAEEYFAFKLKNSWGLFNYYRPKEKGGPASWSDVTEGKSQIMPESFDIERIEIDGDSALVYVRMKMTFSATANMPIRIPDRLKTHVRPERWERFEGTWYKVAVPRPGMSKRKTAKISAEE